MVRSGFLDSFRNLLTHQDLSRVILAHFQLVSFQVAENQFRASDCWPNLLMTGSEATKNESLRWPAKPASGGSRWTGSFQFHLNVGDRHQSCSPAHSSLRDPGACESEIPRQTNRCSCSMCRTCCRNRFLPVRRAKKKKT